MKKFLSGILLVLVFALSVTLVACGHTHTYEDNWSYDANNHYHKPTCGDTAEFADEAPHSFTLVDDGNKEKCDVCGYTRNALIKPHAHTYADKYSADANGHWRVATCAHADEITDSAKHAYADGICSVCGWWSSTTDVLLAELSKLQVWDYTVTFDDVSLANVNLLNEGIELDGITACGELKLDMSADGQFGGSAYLVLSNGQTVKAVVSDGIIYAIVGGNSDGDKYMRFELNELLASNNVDLEQIERYIDELNANTQQIREYVEQLSQYVDLLPEDVISKLLNTFVKADEANGADSLTAYVIDYDALCGLNEMLAATTVADYVDMQCGEGFFAALPQYVEDLFDLRVDQVFYIIETQFGLTFDEVFELIDRLIAKLYPDDKVNTLDQLVAAMGADLKGVRVKELVRLNKLSRLEFILDMAQSKSESPITVEQIVAYVQAFCDAYGGKTIYQLIADNADEITAEQLTQAVGQAIDVAAAMPATFYVDSDGVLRQIALNGEIGSIELTLEQQLIQDYSNVIDEVNAQLNAAKTL